MSEYLVDFLKLNIVYNNSMAWNSELLYLFDDAQCRKTLMITLMMPNDRSNR